MSELTPKQKKFCLEYMIDLNATQAAIRAGYSAKTANEQAARLLTKVSVKEVIDRMKDDRAIRTLVTADYVIKGFVKVAERCMQGEPVVDRNGNETGEWKFDSSGANTALKHLGDHLGILSQRVNIGNADGKPFKTENGADLKEFTTEQLRLLIDKLKE